MTYSFITTRGNNVASNAGYKTKAEAEKARAFHLNGGLTDTVGEVFEYEVAEDQPMRFKMSHGPDGDIRMNRQV